jgi:thioredoxin 1
MLRKVGIFLLMIQLLVSATLKANITLINNLSDFNKIVSQQKVLVKFFAVWCGPCRASHKTIEDFSANSTYKDITFIEVDVDNGSKIANKWKINSIPAFMFFNHGKLIARVNGFNEDAPTRLKQELDNLLNSK